MTAVRDNANAESAVVMNAAAGWDLASLVRIHQTELWRYARFLGATPVEAEDLVQEAFLAVHRKPFEQRSDAESAAYLRMVVRRCLLMARRNQGKQVSETMGEAALQMAEHVWVEQATEERFNGMLAALRQCLELFSGGRIRQALDLFYRDQLSRAQVAEQLGMRSDGVKTLLRRAREKLRDCVTRRQTVKDEET